MTFADFAGLYNSNNFKQFRHLWPYQNNLKECVILTQLLWISVTAGGGAGGAAGGGAAAGGGGAGGGGAGGGKVY